jgi:hypothetical protein
MVTLQKGMTRAYVSKALEMQSDKVVDECAPPINVAYCWKESTRADGTLFKSPFLSTRFYPSSIPSFQVKTLNNEMSDVHLLLPMTVGSEAISENPWKPSAVAYFVAK